MANIHTDKIRKPVRRNCLKNPGCKENPSKKNGKNTNVLVILKNVFISIKLMEIPTANATRTVHQRNFANKNNKTFQQYKLNRNHKVKRGARTKLRSTVVSSPI